MLVGGSLDNRTSLLKDTLSRPYVEAPPRAIQSTGRLDVSVTSGAAGPSYEQWKEGVAANLMRQRETQPQINERSRRLVEHKRLLNATEGHVHDRLHQQALSKQRQRAESSKNASRKAFDLSRHSSPDVGQPRELVNYGERLY